MTEIGNRRLRKIVTTVLVLAWFALSLGMLTAVSLVRDWYDATANGLSALYWLLYVLVVGGWVILLVNNEIRPLFSAKEKVVMPRRTSFSLILSLFGLGSIVANLFGPDWTGKRLFQLTLGCVMVLSFGGELILEYREKRRRTA